MILFTSDWQMKTASLPMVTELVPILHRVCDEEGVKAVVHCGDMKDPLNPLDVRVSNAACEVAESFRLKGIPFYVLLGNHDMTGYHQNSSNWFPTLRAAGATAVDIPAIEEVAGARLFFAPYMRDQAALLKIMDGWKVPAKGLPNVLVMHDAIEGVFSSSKHVLPDGLPRAALARFDFVFSGHIHYPQSSKDGKVWFVGSPYMCDWGELNQQKRLLLFNPLKRIVRSIPLSLPGLYDPAEPEFPKALPAGSTVRIRFAVGDGDTEASAALAVRAKAEAKYPHCKVLTEPIEPEAAEVSAPVKALTDDEAIAAFVKQAVPEHLRGDAEAITHYLTVKLAEVSGGGRQAEGLTFESFEAVNVLSFERVRYKYGAGVTVVYGRNEDWQGVTERSNGSGKTNFLQIPLIALFGKTIKGQAHDAWMRNGSKGECWVKLRLRAAGRLIEITRGRHPKGAEVSVDGGKPETGKDNIIQRRIEELTGLTWDVASAALWIDQRRANRLVYGQDTEKKALLSQFLNLERFNRAQVVVKENRDKRERALTTARVELAACAESVRTLADTVKESKTDDEALSLREAGLEAARVAMRDVEEAGRRVINKASKECEAHTQTATEASNRRNNAVGKLGAARATVERLTGELRRAQKLDVANCPTCGGALNPKRTQERIDELKALLRSAEEDVSEVQKRVRRYDTTITECDQQVAKLEAEKRAADDQVRQARQQLTAAEAELSALRQLHTALDKVRQALRAKKEARASLEELVRTHERDLEIDKFAVACMGKNGVPAYLMMRLCPRLNRAARKYSALIADGMIRVSFAIDAGQDVNTVVENLQGGALLEDQSVGEATSATLIVSLALRDVMLPCNVLAADEPGDGLDEAGARAMAGVFKRLAAVYPSILITSHNPHVLAELSSCKLLEVVKHGKVSAIK